MFNRKCHLPLFFFFFFNDTATTEIYTLSLHDALPICSSGRSRASRTASSISTTWGEAFLSAGWSAMPCAAWPASSTMPRPATSTRSEEHTSELQSPCNLVCRLLLEKKKRYYPPLVLQI